MNFPYSKLRNELLLNKDIEVYKKLLDIFEEPTNQKINELFAIINAINYKQNLSQLIEILIELYSSNKTEYNKKIRFGQLIIWRRILECFVNLEDNIQKLKQCRILYYDDNYLKALSEIKKITKIYYSSQYLINQLEEDLGIDRYLDDILGDELIAATALLAEQESILNEKIEKYKELFQTTWGTDNVLNLICHKMIKYNGDNQICSLTKSGQKRVILFVIDGLGWCQYGWLKSVNSQNLGFIYKENLFKWLEEENLSKELILGAPFITDTAAGICQIMLGKRGNESGILASKLYDSSKHRLLEVKKMDDISTRKCFPCKFNSITDVIRSTHGASEVLYCSRFNNSKTGFSDIVYKNAKIQQIIPPERVYGILKDKCIGEELSPLTIVYASGIDNSGHTMGAFSQLEKTEHNKLNILFKNFLIELVREKEDLFDGDTSILITADHGMTETSKLMISRFDIINELKSFGRDLYAVDDNRSCFIYNIDECYLQGAKNSLRDYFADRNIEVEIDCKGEPNYNNFSDISNGTSDNLLPDIIVRLCSNGLFYANTDLNDHLMHFGGHGGYSVNEVFVPMLDIVLNQELLLKIRQRFFIEA